MQPKEDQAMRLLALILLSLAATLSAQDYKIDASHSALLFSIQHLGLGNTWGRFNDFSGSISYDATKPAAASVSVTAKIASVDTYNEKRDAHLRNADLFDAGTYPTMSFTGTGFTPVEGKEGAYTVTGTLTIRGVSKEITVPFQKLGQGEHAMAKKPAIGFEADFTINPKDFGVGQGQIAGIIPPTARLIVALEAIAP
jgi:polyisoprenoid-binding protein YceI